MLTLENLQQVLSYKNNEHLWGDRDIGNILPIDRWKEKKLTKISSS